MSVPIVHELLATVRAAGAPNAAIADELLASLPAGPVSAWPDCNDDEFDEWDGEWIVGVVIDSETREPRELCSNEFSPVRWREIATVANGRMAKALAVHLNALVAVTAT